MVTTEHINELIEKLKKEEPECLRDTFITLLELHLEIRDYFQQNNRPSNLSSVPTEDDSKIIIGQ